MTIAENITDTWNRIAEIQEAAVRRYALALLGEEIGEPDRLMRRLAARIREIVGEKASLVWCVVNSDALPPGISHESYLAIDTGEEKATPVRIGPVLRINRRGELIALPKSADRP